jgi:hypothetical protein
MKADYSIYPAEVANVLQKFHTGLLEENFYFDHDITEHGEKAMIEAAAPFFMKKWIDGDEEEPTYEELLGIMQKTITYGIIYGLKEKKLIDTIEDENGEEVVFLTKKGKDLKGHLGEP